MADERRVSILALTELLVPCVGLVDTYAFSPTFVEDTAAAFRKVIG